MHGDILFVVIYNVYHYHVIKPRTHFQSVDTYGLKDTTAPVV